MNNMKKENSKNPPKRTYISDCIISGHSLRGLIPLQRSSQYILQPQSTGPTWFSVMSRKLVRKVLPLCKDAVSVFYSPSRLSPDGLISCQNTRWKCLTLLQRCSRCILKPQATGPWWFNIMSEHSLEKSYPSIEMQTVYSKARADWALMV